VIQAGLHNSVDESLGVLCFAEKSIRGSRRHFFKPILMVELSENGNAPNRAICRYTMAMNAFPRRRT
jgi:hypothetical protein